MANPQRKPGSNGFKSEWSAGEILEWLVLLRKVRFALRTGKRTLSWACPRRADYGHGHRMGVRQGWRTCKGSTCRKTIWSSDRKRRHKTWQWRRRTLCLMNQSHPSLNRHRHRWMRRTPLSPSSRRSWRLRSPHPSRLDLATPGAASYATPGTARALQGRPQHVPATQGCW